MGTRLDTGPRCKDHNLMPPCPLCAASAWPLRDLKAIADFAGRPIDHQSGLLPEVTYVRLSAVVRSIGRRWAELEAVKRTILRPIYTTKNRLVHEARIGAIDIGRLEKAAYAVARGLPGPDDALVQMYMRAIADDESDW